MRFDIPVIGLRTIKALRRIRAGVLAVQAGRTIVLGRETVARAADQIGLSFLAQ